MYNGARVLFVEYTVPLVKKSLFILSIVIVLLLDSCNDGEPPANINLDNLEVPKEYLQGKVSFTFDDGVESIYQYALPILSSFNVPATAFITTDWVGTSGFMSWEQVRNLQDQYGWEIGSHTLSHPELPTISPNAYEREIIQSKRILEQQGLKIHSIATPYGAYNNDIVEIVSRHYSSHRGFWDRDDLNSFPFNNTVLMVESVERDTNINQIIKLLNRAKQENKWLVLVFHEVLPNILPDYQYTTLPDDLQKIIEHTLSIDLPIVLPRHVEQIHAYNRIPSPNSELTLVDNISNSTNWTRNHLNAQLEYDVGRFPGTDTSILMQGSSNEVQVLTPGISRNSLKTYIMKCYVNTLALTSGHVQIYSLSFDGTNNMLSKNLLGSVAADKVTELSFRLEPVDSGVEKIAFMTVLSSGSQGVVRVDDYQLYQLAD